MRQITVESTLSDQLSELTGQAFLCDSEGRVLGAFSPWREHPRIDELQLEPPSTIEEILERRKNLNGNFGKPLGEILKRWGLE